MIRSAKKEEAEILTKISFKSKGYWNYPKEYFKIWNGELTISPDGIEKNEVFVFELGGAVPGYYSFVELLECSMKKWDVYSCVNIRQQLRIQPPLICNYK